jgi:hypothetical protein
MRVAVSKDCGRALVPATRDIFMLGRDGSANERANEEKEGKVEVEAVEAAEVPDSCGGRGGSCFGGVGGGWASAFAQASRALFSSYCTSGSNVSRMSVCT